MIRSEVASSALHPNCMVPRQMRATFKPELPNLRYSIVNWLPVRIYDQQMPPLIKNEMT
jgi:hypothetical protein